MEENIDLVVAATVGMAYDPKGLDVVAYDPKGLDVQQLQRRLLGSVESYRTFDNCSRTVGF